ncbi:MAG: CHAT domain-containing protein [Planctomycetes bacterium]|nr:CHAT domain-containing protein [Planctomycetota bacterium]
MRARLVAASILLACVAAIGSCRSVATSVERSTPTAVSALPEPSNAETPADVARGFEAAKDWDKALDAWLGAARASVDEAAANQALANAARVAPHCAKPSVPSKLEAARLSVAAFRSEPAELWRLFRDAEGRVGAAQGAHGRLLDALASALRRRNAPSEARRAELERAALADAEGRAAVRVLHLLAASRDARAAGERDLARQDEANALTALGACESHARSEALQYLGAHYEAIGRPRDAAQVYANLARSSDDDPVSEVEGVLLECQVDLDLGRYATASAELDALAAKWERLALEDLEPQLRAARDQLFAKLAFRTGESADVWRHARAVFDNECSLYDSATALTLSALCEIDGDLAAARSWAENALAGARQSASVEDELGALNNLGRIARLGGHVAEAEGFHRRQLEFARANADAAYAANAETGLAHCALDRGRVEGVGESASAAADRLVAQGLPEHAGHALLVVARAALARRDLAAFGAARRRAAELLERDDLDVLDRRVQVGVRSQFYEWGELIEDAVTLEFSLGLRSREAVLRDGWSGAEHYKARVLAEGLSAGIGSAEASSSEAELARSFRDGRLLAEFSAGRERLFVYVRDGDLVERFDLGPRRALDADLREFLGYVSKRNELIPPSRIAETGSRLYRALLAPWLELRYERTKTLTIVPTGELSALPFDALVRGVRTPDGAPPSFDDVEFVLDRLRVSYAPSCALLVDRSVHAPAASAGPAVLFGDPDYRSGRDSADAPRLPALDRSRAEVLCTAHAVARTRGQRDTDLSDALALVESRNSERVSSPALELRVGTSATREEFARLAQSASILHLAVHGIVDPRDPRASGVAFAYEPEFGGLVSANELAALAMSADLVVLAACDSARGKILRGDGVQSLAYAFLVAHSRSVIASLWAVDDTATERTMCAFYDALLDRGLPASEALWEAKRLCRRASVARATSADESPARREPQPYDWAPFIYVGLDDGR